MKALTLWQPWASLISLEEKKIETRCWTTKHRGELAIHAAATLPPKWLGASRHGDEFRSELAHALTTNARALPRGVVLCIVKLISIEETSAMLRETLPTREMLFGNYEDGRYAWHMEVIERFATPIPAKGNRMLWNWERP